MLEYFLLYLLVEIQQLAHKISSFLDILYNKAVTDRNQKQSSTAILSKDVLKKFAKFGVYF